MSKGAAVVISLVLSGCALGGKTVPPWEPSVLSKQGCPDIDGTYKNGGAMEGLHYFSKKTWIKTDVSERSSENDQVLYTIMRNLPYGGGSIEDYFAGRKAFNDNAVMTITKRGTTIELLLKDGSGIEYTTTLIQLNHRLVGCVNGALVIRWQTFNTAGEGGPGEHWAGELKYRKDADGNLHVTRQTMKWIRNMYGEPERKEAAFIFPSVKSK